MTKHFKISHNRTMDILKSHGWTPRTNTMAYKG